MVHRRAVEWLVFVAPLPLAIIVAYVFPLLGVLRWSFTDPTRGLQNYDRIMVDDNIHAIAWRTLDLCLTTTVAAVLIAYLLAYHWTFGPPWRRRFVELCVLIPFWISVLIRAFGWLIVLRPKGLLNEWLLAGGLISEPLALVRNDLGVVIGMVHFMVPFAVFPILAVMRQIDPRIMSAARGLGAGPVRRFLEIFLPLSLPGVIGSVFIVFVFTLGFFITPAILGGGRVVMIAEYIFTQMSQTAKWGLGAALAVSLLLVVSIMIGALLKLVRIEQFAR
ncbi:ABC transporter permease [Mesorhizobium sp. CU2]|uniref:ABC transporter permease n=1 Tax=unclassified Mesorhizobium TaxID=325217 RepID=UPI00112B3984|nr:MULTISPECIES: ABC transporter permease [unclassified Mesorhizobium]TPN82583.1 ABC transporter permease [Mesorhizobium sp. CU3]TPO12787.1 ABC transporter permease [Mesorhizobium sp. CU2]